MDHLTRYNSHAVGAVGSKGEQAKRKQANCEDEQALKRLLPQDDVCPVDALLGGCAVGS